MRAAMTALAAVLALTAPTAPLPVLGQTAARPPARKTPPLSSPLAPLSSPAPYAAQLDSRVPDGRAPGFRGGFADKDPPVSGSANYGAPRPRVKLPKPYPPPRVGAPPPFSPKNPLPPLEPYKTSALARRAARLRTATPTRAFRPPPPTTVAVQPAIKVKPRPKIERNPYDPVGTGVGSLRVTPFVEAAFGYDSNPNRLSSTTPHGGSRLLRGDAGLAVKSEWARHDFVGNLRLGYSEYFDVPAASRPDGVGAFDARYDVTRDTALTLGGRFTLDTQRPGAPAIYSGLPNVTVVNRPTIFSFGAAPGVTQKFNRLELSLRGAFDRTMYQNAFYSDGTSLNLKSTDFNAYGLNLRVAYEATPDLKPFVDATIDKRIHDTPVDVWGYRRDGNGMVLRGGATIRISDLLKGEASGGYGERTYADPRLPKLRGPTIDASLIYTPSALTTVTLRGVTTLNETTVSGAAGALTRSISAQVTHDLLRNLTVTAIGTFYANDYQGTNLKERGYSAAVRLDYKITRSIAIRGSFTHERLDSTARGSDYTANVYLVGLRFQI